MVNLIFILAGVVVAMKEYENSAHLL